MIQFVEPAISLILSTISNTMRIFKCQSGNRLDRGWMLPGCRCAQVSLASWKILAMKMVSFHAFCMDKKFWTNAAQSPKIMTDMACIAIDNPWGGIVPDCMRPNSKLSSIVRSARHKWWVRQSFSVFIKQFSLLTSCRASASNNPIHSTGRLQTGHQATPGQIIACKRFTCRDSTFGGPFTCYDLLW